MSHFTVVVVGENPEKQLAPFHEYECTGVDDEFVHDIDKKEEVIKEYKESKKSMVKTPDGELVDPYDDRFYREMTLDERIKHKNDMLGFQEELREKGMFVSNKRIHFIPEDCQEIEIPLCECMTLREYVESEGYDIVESKEEVNVYDKHKFRYAVFNGNEAVEIVQRTNPNSKWDWYMLGGRWTVFWKLKKGVQIRLGRPGIGRNEARKGYSDQARICDIDLDGMIEDRVKDALELWDKVHEVLDKHPPIIKWCDIDKTDIKKARKEYNGHPAMRELWDKRLFVEVEDFIVPQEKYIDDVTASVAVPFAVVMNEKWYAKGDMGWWAVTSNEINNWPEEYQKLIKDLPPETKLSLYDCHI